MGDGINAFGQIVGGAAKGALSGGSSGGGIISTPFKAIKTGANSVQGITKNITNFYRPNTKRKSRFRKKI